MKNNPNSLINKFADIHSELVKLNKRIANAETMQERSIEDLRSEVQSRQNIEKKAYQQGELLNGKIFSLRKGLEDLTSTINNQIDNIKENNENALKNNNNNLLQSLQDKLNKIETLENKTKQIDTEINKNNDDYNKKFVKGLDSLTDNFRILKNDLTKQGAAVEVVEKRLGEFYSSLVEDIRDLIKQMSVLKNDVEMLKQFKESSLVNFRDISNQFIDNDKDMKDFKSKISNIVRDTESKLRLMDVNTNSQLEQIENTKKEIYAQLYDNNLSHTNKFQLMNESLVEKFEDYDKLISKFQENILNENSKFTDYIADQLENHQKNNKKIFDYMSNEMMIVKEKSYNSEVLVKSLKGELLGNLSEMEEFFTKKYEYLFRIVNSSNPINYSIASPRSNTNNQFIK